ncbi:MAG: glutamate synthase-related protein [Thermaerobacter sp.]|nr:glutamate synthase-related protein [Thermaerobacter sp.]
MENQHAHFIQQYIGREHDACAIYAAVSKRPAAPHDTPVWVTGLRALDFMDHRAGWVDERTDGTGLLTDIPRAVWQRRLEEAGHGGSAYGPDFWILTLVTPMSERREARNRIAQILTPFGFQRVMAHVELTEGQNALDAHALLYTRSADGWTSDAWQALQALERAFPGRLASFSNHQAIVKMTASPATLHHLIETEWGGHEFLPRAVIGHNRFSTNTLTDLARVQPFLGLAHNGEVNTIDRLQRELTALAIEPIPQGSDSQNLDRLLTALVWQFGLTHAEAGRLAISPSPAILNRLPAAEKAVWDALQAFWGPLREGPAAIVHRLGRSVVAGVDALGLRPLWLLETETQYVLSSEPGVVPIGEWVAEPHNIGPGEIIAIEWEEGGEARVVHSDAITARLARRVPRDAGLRVFSPALENPHTVYPDWQLVADGWHRDDQAMIKTLALDGHEPIGSLGYDGPLGPFNDGITTLSDFLQETVAVVTNPALDRERESEHFRLRMLLGGRPDLGRSIAGAASLWLDSPWLTEAGAEQAVAHFGRNAATLPMRLAAAADELSAARALAADAVRLVQAGCRLLVLDDRDAYQAGLSVSLDPALATGAVDGALRQAGLRRRAGIVLRSGMIRHLHDAMILIGLGADALVPYLIWSQVAPDRMESTLAVMNGGLEKILSTMGIHELQGYGHVFSAIGLPREIADVLGVISFAAPDYENWVAHRRTVIALRLAQLGEKVKPKAVSHATPYIYKWAIKMAQGQLSGLEYLAHARAVEQKHPIALRHTLGFRGKPQAERLPVSLAVGDHDLPFVISSMSFGSQGETAFRAYAEAAKALNMLSMNGEGGEIPDMIGRYYEWRGHQVASGRFGVNTRLLNGARYAEIKIGQGAKPGEGGHLPGKKVSAKVANARSAVPGVDLISPSNNHDLYSIEDLKQLIDELKQANPDLRVVVKVPVVPNIGTIAVGIVKAGADAINLSGFEGGTGAARMHALRHVGLPADIGVPLTHAALTLAGLRERVEIWADGGLRSADDVMRMVLLGADRVGFATMAMVALGCTICRSCQSDTCHVGITTQIESLEEAQERGLKHFRLQDSAEAVEHLVRFFRGLAEGLTENLQQLGFQRLSDAVGQAHLLIQERFQGLAGYEDFLQQLTAAISHELASQAVQAVGEVGRLPDAFARWSKPRTRTIGTGISGQRIRRSERPTAVVNPVRDVAGQGFGAFLSDGVALVAHGGAQDGVAKGASGGTIAVLKGRGANGAHYGGHVGKSLAYGAQGGTFIVQGGADARAGIRLAGADVVILADGVTPPSQARTLWDSAAIKGFGFEYMTRGRGLVLGDPGPWLASGMTGGTVYLRVAPELGLTREFLASRLARAAKVAFTALNPDDIAAVQTLLAHVVEAYGSSGQDDRIAALEILANNPVKHFVKVVPQAAQTDPDISTE